MNDILFFGIIFVIYSIVSGIISIPSLVFLSSFTQNTTFLIIMGSLGLLLNILIAITIFRKRMGGPKWIIIFVWISFVLGLLNLFLYVIPNINNSAATLGSLGIQSSFISSSITYLIITSSLGLALNILITLYFIKSERVKNTFIK